MFQLTLRLFLVQLPLIPADAQTAAIMGTFQHELIGQPVKIDILKSVPHAKGRNDIFLSQDFRYILLCSVLIHHGGIDILPIMQLQPLKLFIEALRILQICFFPNSTGKEA